MQSYRTLLSIFVAVFVLLGFQFMSAAWGAPTAIPPNNNADVPINTGSTTQVKSGNFNASPIQARSAIWSDRYCDALGYNCIDTPQGRIITSCPEGTAIRAINPDGSVVCQVVPAAPPLVVGRTDAECTALGGTPLTVNGQRICRLNAASCPAGWQQFQSWSTYPSQSCGGGCSGRCSTAGLAWGNNTGAIPSCVYQTGRDTARGCDFTGTAICTAVRTQIGCY